MSEPARPPLPLEREVHLCEAQSTNEQLKGVFTTIQNFVSRFRRRSTHFDTSDEHLVYRQWCPTTEPRVGLEEPTMGTVAAKFQRCLTHSRLFKTFTLVSSTAIFGGAVSDHTERKQYCFLSGPFCSQTRPAPSPHVPQYGCTIHRSGELSILDLPTEGPVLPLDHHPCYWSQVALNTFATNGSAEMRLRRGFSMTRARPSLQIPAQAEDNKTIFRGGEQ